MLQRYSFWHFYRTKHKFPNVCLQEEFHYCTENFETIFFRQKNHFDLGLSKLKTILVLVPNFYLFFKIFPSFKLVAVSLVYIILLNLMVFFVSKVKTTAFHKLCFIIFLRKGMKLTTTMNKIIQLKTLIMLC